MLYWIILLIAGSGVVATLLWRWHPPNLANTLLAFSQMSADIASSLDEDQVLSHAWRQLQAVIAADSILIYLADPQSPGVLRLKERASQPLAERAAPSATIDLRHSSLFGQVIADRQPWYVANAAGSSHAETFAQWGVQAGAIIPGSVDGHLICALVAAYDQPHAFDANERAILNSVGQQVAVALRNARLHDQERRQRHIAEVFGQVAGMWGNRSLEEALQSLLEQLGTLVFFERATVMLNHAPGMLRVAAQQGLTEVTSAADLDQVRIAIDRYPYLARLFEQRLPQLVSNTMRDEQWQSDSYPRGSWIGVPLVVHDQVLGCFSLSHHQVDFFTEQDLQMITAFAAQAAIAVENAQLFDREQHRRRQAELLYDMAYKLVASPDLESALHAALIDLAKICPFDRAHVGLLIAEGTAWMPRALYPVEAELPRDPVVAVEAYPLVGDVIATRQAMLIPDTRTCPRWKAGRFSPREVRSWLGVPLVVRDKVIGIFNIDSFVPHQFTEEHRQVVQSFCVHVSGVVEMFRLVEEADRRLEHLRLVNEVGRYAAAILRVRTLIDGVAARLYASLHYDTISVTQVEDGHLTVLAVYDHGDYVTPPPAGYPEPCETAVRAYERAVPARSQDAIHDETPREDDAPRIVKVLLAVPMILTGEVIGVLTVERRAYCSWAAEEDLDLLEPLCAQLAISVSNARLFETVRQQALELEGRVAERTHQIRQQQEHTEAILSSVVDAVIVLDLQGHPIKMNGAARQLFDQYDLDHTLNAPITHLIEQAQLPANLSDDWSGNLADNLAATGLFTEEIEVGAVVLQAKAARVRVGDEMLGTVIVLRDISALKELDRLRDTFVSQVSHELRTPLANVKLYLSLVEKGRPERRADYLAVMQTEIDRLERLITDLLHLSRLRSEYHGDRTPLRETLQLEYLIWQVITANSVRTEQQGLHLVYEPLHSEPLPPVVGDADQLVRALTNLVSNAVSYTLSGGTIAIRTRVAYRLEHANSEWVIIEVVDTGIGIPPDELLLVFDRFYRASNVRLTFPGTGLGLAIIKEIIELHGGTIDVDSEVGRGTTFRVALPAQGVEELEGGGKHYR